MIKQLSITTLILRFACFCTVILLTSNGYVQALSADQKKVYQSGIYTFDVAVQSSGSSSCEQSITLTGNSNVAKAFNYFTQQGLSNEQAAGIVGNLMAESGVFPARKQGMPTSYKATLADIHEAIRRNKADSHDGFGVGIAQWTTWTRLQGLLDFAKSNDPLTLETQLPYLYEKELPGNGLPELKQSQDLRQATWIFLAFFERPGTVVDAGLARNPHQPASGAAKETLDTRTNLAQGVLRSGGAGGASSGDSGSCDSSTDSGPGQIISANGFTFPLKTTRETITGNSPAWCFNKTANCHHDYNAADIFVPTGTEVVSVKPGKVMTVHDTANRQWASATGSRVAIMGDDGILYYYAHMGKGTLVLREGQRVKAGDTIGKVGVNADAEGTDHHLHINALPGDRYHYEPSCTGAACKQYPFINIQPTLAEVFKSFR